MAGAVVAALFHQFAEPQPTSDRLANWDERAGFHISAPVAAHTLTERLLCSNDLPPHPSNYIDVSLPHSFFLSDQCIQCCPE